MKLLNRLKGLSILSTSLALFATLQALPTATNAQQPPENAPPSVAAQTEGLKSSKQLSAHDIAFMKQAAEGNRAEIESSQLAAKKATHPEVKAFALKMVEDHSKTGKELENLAASKGVTLPKQPSVAQKLKLNLLESAERDTFDKLYSEHMGVRAHVQTVELFRKASQQAKDPQVKSFATSTLPALERHLKMARELPTAKER